MGNMGRRTGGSLLTLLFSISLLVMSQATADSAEEMQKCVETMGRATTCLPYLGGDAKAPTPDCCNGLIYASYRCICLVVKDRNDPDLGMKINITLAFRLPYLCKAPVNWSLCPAILHLDPNSPEAREFNQVNSNFTNAGSSSNASTPSDNSSLEGARTGSPTENGGRRKRKRMLVPRILVAGLVLWFS